MKNPEQLISALPYQFAGDIGIEFYRGWMGIFSRLCFAIDEALGDDKRGFHWTQVKEKFGSEAIIRLKKAVQIAPQHAHAWTGIGVAYQRMGKPELALEPTKRAVAADPSDGYAQRNLGALLLGLGRKEESLQHLRISREAMPHDPQTTFGLAAALQASGDEAAIAEADELYVVVIERWPGSEVAEQARLARTKIAHKNLRTHTPGCVRPEVVMYIAAALKTLADAGTTKSHQIALEIALKGQDGLDINDPDAKYELKTLPGSIFSGLQLVSMLYTAVKQVDPTADAGVNFDAEYKVASAMQNE